MATKTPAGFPDHDALRTATVRSVAAALDRAPTLVDKPKTLLRARRADVLDRPSHLSVGSWRSS